MKNLQNSGKEWSAADLKKLEKLADGNTPTGLIAYELKRSVSAIYSKASDENISLHPTNKSPYSKRK
ncbi:MAG: hypothetical protein COS14_05035 [Bacteroidetes bacterium CG02_land_8_20_14_3_00_31_25]|nr:hypothetical protein [Bacteroidota bacterium]PIV60302.1 MAG: hypothetical protein COS14_05035 [Bacteroidetes bacterium CG02_land_8_20_14_3_00_31_25]PIX36313.1 MAG: hypothetical protein COZ59_01770 [Bacteroidetes bacterium CG_4_8_14_3_um_filter_31_14]PIY03632.1 MAG: hypothetical protein COZ21_08710 [Bacteroidetes bacterium CG_4_10_14_3_um_filter_31_20]